VCLLGGVDIHIVPILVKVLYLFRKLKTIRKIALFMMEFLTASSCLFF
jgi:hypothetical protein